MKEGEGRRTSTSTKPTPHPEDVRLQVASVGGDHVGCDDSDDGVPEPVGRCRERDTARADLEREDFADDDPGGGTPCRGEEGDVDGDEGDLGVDGGDVVGDGDAGGGFVRLWRGD